MLGVQVALGPRSDAEEIAEANPRLRREFGDLDISPAQLLRVRERPLSPAGWMRRRMVHWWSTLLIRSWPGGVAVAALRSRLAKSPRRSRELQLGGDVLEMTGCH